jgi:hypothetical protein
MEQARQNYTKVMELYRRIPQERKPEVFEKAKLLLER